MCQSQCWNPEPVLTVESALAGTFAMLHLHQTGSLVDTYVLVFRLLDLSVTPLHRRLLGQEDYLQLSSWLDETLLIGGHAGGICVVLQLCKYVQRSEVLRMGCGNGMGEGKGPAGERVSTSDKGEGVSPSDKGLKGPKMRHLACTS